MSIARRTALVLALGLAFNAIAPLNAQAAVMNFNSVPVLGTASPIVSLPGGHVENGFRLSTRGGVSFTFSGGQIYALTPTNPYWSGTPSVYSDIGTPQYGSAFRFEKADGGAFSLLSLDAAAFHNHPNSLTFSVYGVTTGGPVVSKVVTLDTSFTTLQTIAFGSEFSSLSYVIFSSVYAQVDNIQATFAGEVLPQVPEPGALVLALAGGAMLMSRRRSSRND